MKRSLSRIPLFAFLVIVAAARFGQAETCTDCHSNTGKGHSIHPAVAMGCDGCHVAPHADKDKPVLSLKTNQPGLCFSCHAAYSNQGMHAALEAVSCTECHSPHASAFDKVLKTNQSALCEKCHDGAATGKHIVKGFLKGPHPVEGKLNPLKAGTPLSCVACHNPHQSPLPRLFTTPRLVGPQRCNACHLPVNAASKP